MTILYELMRYKNYRVSNNKSEENTGYTWISTRTSVYILWLLTWNSCWIPNWGSSCVSDSFAYSWDSFGPFRFSFRTSLWVLLHLILPCFVLFGGLFLLVEEIEGSAFGGKQKWRGVRKKETGFCLNCMRVEFTFNKRF